MTDPKRRRKGYIARTLFGILVPHLEGLRRNDALAALRERINLTEEERTEIRPRTSLFDQRVRFITMDYVRAGWLRSHQNRWLITEAGQEAFTTFADPDLFDAEARKLREERRHCDFHEEPFEALCTLAARERWCWKIGCTTCGCMYFRYAFRELAYGKQPHSTEWRIQKPYYELERYLGPIPDVEGWPLTVEHALTTIIAKARLSRIAAASEFPDWLGYVGLALLFTQTVEKSERVLTKSWAPQFLEMIPADGRQRVYLEGLLQPPPPGQHVGVLTWRCLEGIERDLAVVRRHNRP